MSSDKSGPARQRRISAPTTGVEYDLRGVTKSISISNITANPLRVYLDCDTSKADFDADANYVELPATSGFLKENIQITTLRMRGVGGTTTAVVLATLDGR